METWRLFHTWDAEPGFNMALDEALLVGTGERPTLRFYTWKPDALSLGYFQRWSEVEGFDRAGAVVRRLTGGGAIHHSSELTFSIAAPLEHPLYRGPIAASYERVHAAIAAAFADVGVRAAPRGAEALASDLETSGLCFRRSTSLDLIWDGRKGVGSAQRRTKGRVLHHGSIKLGRTPIEESIAALWDHAPGLRADELAERIAERLAEGHGLSFEVGEPEGEELEHALKRAAFFTSEEWVKRR